MCSRVMCTSQITVTLHTWSSTYCMVCARAHHHVITLIKKHDSCHCVRYTCVYEIFPSLAGRSGENVWVEVLSSSPLWHTRLHSCARVFSLALRVFSCAPRILSCASRLHSCASRLLSCAPFRKAHLPSFHSGLDVSLQRFPGGIIASILNT